MNKIILFLIVFIASPCLAQDGFQSNTLDYDPERLKLIPDKVFEFGVPLLFVFLLLNAIVSILKNRAEHQLKMKLVEKGIPDQTLIEIFRESNAMVKLQPLRWFLFSLALAISFVIIHFFKNYMVNQSGYLPLGIILFFTSLAALIYYRILQHKV